MVIDEQGGLNEAAIASWLFCVSVPVGGGGMLLLQEVYFLV